MYKNINSKKKEEKEKILYLTVQEMNSIEIIATDFQGYW